MPCNSDYLKADVFEKEQRRAAQLLVFVLERTQQPVPPAVAQKAEDYYGRGPDAVPLLCAALTSLSDAQRDAVVYNARNKTSRDVADWWERHQEADRAREAEQRAADQRRALSHQAAVKLTPEELAALRGDPR